MTKKLRVALDAVHEELNRLHWDLDNSIHRKDGVSYNYTLRKITELENARNIAETSADMPDQHLDSVADFIILKIEETKK